MSTSVDQVSSKVAAGIISNNDHIMRLSELCEGNMGANKKPTRPKKSHGNDSDRCVMLLQDSGSGYESDVGLIANDDGIARISWDNFLGLGVSVPTLKEKRKKQQEGQLAQILAENHARQTPRVRKRRRVNRSSGEDHTHQSAKRFKVSWGERFQQLKEFYQQHGHTRFPVSYEENQGFADWVHKQRMKYTARTKGNSEAMSDGKFSALHRLGFEPLSQLPESEQFDHYFSQLRTFKREHNHFRVPEQYEPAPDLRDFVKRIRTLYRTRHPESQSPSSLTEQQIEALNGMGFPWENKRHRRGKSKADDESVSNEKRQSLNAAWMNRLHQLKEYYREHGNFRVPGNYKPDPSLAGWVRQQRGRFTLRMRGKKTAMTDHKFEALNNSRVWT